MRFMQVMEKIDDFLKNTPEDIFEFSIELEDILVDDYDEMQSEQPLATYYLSQDVPGICSGAEPGMSKTEIDKFKKRLQSEYERAKSLIQ